MEKYVGLLFLVPMIGLAAFIADIEQGNIESYTNLFISAVSGFAMIGLTYYLYLINKKMMLISEDTLKVNKYQMGKIETNEANRLLGKLEEYGKCNEIILFMTLPHLPYSKKKIYLETNFPERLDREIMSSNLWVDTNIDMKTSWEIKLTEDEQERYNYVIRNFDSIIPSSVKARYKLIDVKSKFNSLKAFNQDSDFYRFTDIAQNQKHTVEFLETRLETIFTENDNVIIPELKIDQYTADSIFGISQQINNFLIQLKDLVIKEHSSVMKTLKKK